jgi:glycosyltransferase involved in cell wall biosynthesis
MNSSETPGRGRPLRFLIVVTHFVQYVSPLYRLMAKDPRIELLVAYCGTQGAEVSVDPEFGVALAWDTPVTEGYPYVIVPNRSLRPGLGRFWGCFNPGIWRLMRDGKFDAVYVTGYYTASHWIAMLAAKRYGVSLILSTDAHDLGSRRFRSTFARSVKRRIVRRIFGMADVVMAMSSGGIEYLQSLLPGTGREGRIRLSRYVVDNDWWLQQAAKADRKAVRERWNVPAEAAVALFCAKLQDWKRPGDVLRAFASADVPGSYLVFAGSGPLASQLEVDAKQLGIADRVRFLGFVNQTGLPGTYVASDLLVLPSSHEPFGLVVNEAMICGCPVAVSNSVGAARDLVSEGQTGFIFTSGDVAALAEILRQALPDRQRLEQMGRAARSRMESWSPPDYVEDIIAAVQAAHRRSIEGRRDLTRSS